MGTKLSLEITNENTIEVSVDGAFNDKKFENLDAAFEHIKSLFEATPQFSDFNHGRFNRRIRLEINQSFKDSNIDDNQEKKPTGPELLRASETL